MTQPTQDFASIVATVGGYQAKGFGPGTPLRWAKSRGKVEMAIGARGFGSFMKINDQSAVLEMDIDPTSQDNGVFGRFFRNSESVEGGFLVEVVVRDISGTDELSALCMIEGEPDVSWGEAGGVRTWRFLGVKWSVSGGGRGQSPTQTIDDLPAEADIPAIPEIS